MPTPTFTPNKPYDLHALAAVLQAYSGQSVSKQTLTTWISEGRFPGATKRNPTAKNSKFAIPAAGIAAYVAGAFPLGPQFEFPSVYADAVTNVAALVAALGADPA